MYNKICMIFAHFTHLHNMSANRQQIIYKSPDKKTNYDKKVLNKNYHFYHGISIIV